MVEYDVSLHAYEMEFVLSRIGFFVDMSQHGQY